MKNEELFVILQKTILFFFSYKGVSVISWPVINRRFSKDHPNILALVDLVLTIPAHSADAERGFSEMKMVKTDWRSGLRPAILSDLLFIMFHTEAIGKYDPTDAVKLWNASSTRARRPTLEPYGPRAATEDDMDIDISIWEEMDVVSKDI